MIKINNWTEVFENADTRKRQRLGWYLAPSGCDSRGYRMLMRKGADGVMALGVFSALCQVMATLSRPVRESGILANSDGTGMELADLSEMTRMEVADIRHATGILQEVGWLTLENQQSATFVPPSCHPRATRMPENSGFVKGEGEGEGEVPPNPQGGGGDPRDEFREIRAMIPSGALRKSKTDQKQIRISGLTDLMRRLNRCFGRKDERWTVYEANALLNIKPSKEEVDLIEERYLAIILENDWRRQDLATLLNNWNSELDRARVWKSNAA